LSKSTGELEIFSKKFRTRNRTDPARSLKSWSRRGNEK